MRAFRFLIKFLCFSTVLSLVMDLFNESCNKGNPSRMRICNKRYFIFRYMRILFNRIFNFGWFFSAKTRGDLVLYAVF